jgi:hypothetical protein
MSQTPEASQHRLETNMMSGSRAERKESSHLSGLARVKRWPAASIFVLLSQSMAGRFVPSMTSAHGPQPEESVSAVDMN